MNINLEITVSPFPIPEHVFVNPANINLETTAWKASSSIPLSSLDNLTLDKLCQEFRKGIFAKAGKGDTYPAPGQITYRNPLISSSIDALAEKHFDEFWGK